MLLKEIQPEVINPDGKSGLVILCDHASNHVPSELNQLGLSETQLQQHIAWDIGAAAVSRLLCEKLDATAVLASVSRLVIDCNREEERDTLIPPTSDGHKIDGNQELSDAARNARIDAYYKPFHKACKTVIDQRLTDGDQTTSPVLVAMHSFTPVMDDFKRPWEIGFLWNADKRLAQAMMDILERDTDFTVGDNEPYSGKDLYHTMGYHGMRRGIPQTTVEIRQDLIGDEAGVREWAQLMANILEECLEDKALRQFKYFDE